MITEDEGGGSVLYPVPVLNSNFGADNQGEQAQNLRDRTIIV